MFVESQIFEEMLMRSFVLCLIALLSGCVISTGTSCVRGTVITVVNNTCNAYLDILIDSQVFTCGLPPGEHCGVPIGQCQQANVTIIGRDKHGDTLGATSDLFYGGEPRYYNYDYYGCPSGSTYSRTWVINTCDLRRRE